MTDGTMSWADLGLGDLDISQVEAAADFVDTVGEGVFECITQGLVLGKHDKSGAVYARLGYEIATGEHAGKKVEEMFWDLGNAERWSRNFLKKRMLTLGLPEDFQGMPDPDNFKNIPVVITRKKKGDYFNVVDVKLANESSTQEAQVPTQPAEPVTSNDVSSFFN